MARGLLFYLGMSFHPAEEFARELGLRIKGFLSLLTEQVSQRLRERITGFLTESVFLLAAGFCIAGVGIWLSMAGWNEFRERGLSGSTASALVALGFLLFASLFYLAGRARAYRSTISSVQILDPENMEVEEAGRELITVFKDLKMAVKHSFSPNEILKPHAVKFAVASTALGFLVALNMNARKEKIR